MGASAAAALCSRGTELICPVGEARAAGGAWTGACVQFWDFHIEPAPPQVALRVLPAPAGAASSGARRMRVADGDEVAVLKLERLEALAPLGWRQARAARTAAGAGSGAGAGGCSRAPAPDYGVPWPRGGRCGAPSRCWRARVLACDPGGGYTEHGCLLQVAAAPESRHPESALAAIQDSEAVAAYAGRFNAFVSAQGPGGADCAGTQSRPPPPSPFVQVAVPVMCEVLGSVVPQIVAVGDVVLLTPYPLEEVRKLVFDGKTEAYLELPQAFFHFSAHASGGREFVWDLQGAELESEDDAGDDPPLLLVDPCVLRLPPVSVGDIVNVLAPAPAPGRAPEARQGPSRARFDLLHPRCGPLCSKFDPHRRGAHARLHCGVTTADCGL